MVNLLNNESQDSTHEPKVFHERPLTLREAIERMDESQQIVSRKVRLHHESEIRALGAQAQVEKETASMPSDVAFEAAAEQIAAEASAVYEAERMVSDEADLLAQANRAIEDAFRYEAGEQ